MLLANGTDKLMSVVDAWKSMCGDEEMEDLDPLMNGQSHRAHLNEVVRESGGQEYGKIPSVSQTIPKAAKSLGVSGSSATTLPTRGRKGASE